MNKPAKKSGTIIGRFLTFALMLIFVSMLSACATDPSLHTMAPPPPVTRDASFPVPKSGLVLSVPPHYAVEKRNTNPLSSPLQDAAYEVALNSKNKGGGKCRIKDRFDRKMLLAYEFDDDQSRLGFDVDGVGFDNMNIEQVRFEFNYKFSPGKTKKQKCRYRSSFQGIAGSAYNELFIRDKDTIWTELDERGLSWWR